MFGSIKEKQAVFVRTVSFYYIGRLEYYDGEIMELSGASWVADTGRFAKALSEGTLSEVEPYPNNVILQVGAIVDVSPWGHKLPRKVIE